MTPEAKVVGQITRYLDSLKKQGEPIWYVKLHGSNMQRAGLPDLHVCYAGHAIYLEVKAPGGKLTPLQQHTLRALHNAGATVGVVMSVDDVRRELAGIRISMETE